MTKSSFFTFAVGLLACLTFQQASLAGELPAEAATSLKQGCPLAYVGDHFSLAQLPPQDRRGFGGPEMCPKACPKHGGPFAALTGQNALTDEQYEKLHSLRLGFMSKMDPVMAELRAGRRELNDLMVRSVIDNKKVWEIQKTINGACSKMADLSLENRLDNLNVLTAEQRQEIRIKMVRGEDHCPARKRAWFRR